MLLSYVLGAGAETVGIPYNEPKVFNPRDAIAKVTQVTSASPLFLPTGDLISYKGTVFSLYLMFRWRYTNLSTPSSRQISSLGWPQARARSLSFSLSLSLSLSLAPSFPCQQNCDHFTLSLSLSLSHLGCHRRCPLCC